MHRGMTLLELVVALVILAIIVGVSSVWLGTGGVQTMSEIDGLLWSARRQALADGRPVTVRHHLEGHLVAATVFPDGSIVADSLLRVNRLTGRSKQSTGETPP